MCLYNVYIHYILERINDNYIFSINICLQLLRVYARPNCALEEILLKTPRRQRCRLARVPWDRMFNLQSKSGFQCQSSHLSRPTVTAFIQNCSKPPARQDVASDWVKEANFPKKCNYLRHLRISHKVISAGFLPWVQTFLELLLFYSSFWEGSKTSVNWF